MVNQCCAPRETKEDRGWMGGGGGGRRGPHEYFISWVEREREETGKGQKEELKGLLKDGWDEWDDGPISHSLSTHIWIKRIRDIRRWVTF